MFARKFRFGRTVDGLRSMSTAGFVPELKALLSMKIGQEIEKIKGFRKKYGKSKVSEVSVDTVYGGLRGCVCLWCDTSHLDPMEGIRFRGYSIPELQKLLPKAEGSEQPLPEGLFWLMLTGEVPSKAQVDQISAVWAANADLPDHVEQVLDDLPHEKIHPMTQFSSAINLLNCDSVFNRNLNKIKKAVYWEYLYNDAMLLIPKLTVIAAKIYRNTFKNEKIKMKVDPDKDWAANFATMLGFDDQVAEVMRLYLTLHADHEGGNVSSHTTHLIGSTLADPYLSLAGGINGLAGPLHGLANQECLAFIMLIRDKIGETPSDDVVKKFVQDHLASGHVVPGFGHAVLRKTDPRFTCFKEFADQHMADDPLHKLLTQFVRVAIPTLQATGKVKNPYPNVDCHSGVILHHYNIVETNFYTVLFGISRALGVLSSLIWHRAVGIPIERPNSITTAALMKLFNAK